MVTNPTLFFLGQTVEKSWPGQDSILGREERLKDNARTNQYQPTTTYAGEK